MKSSNSKHGCGQYKFSRLELDNTLVLINKTRTDKEKDNKNVTNKMDKKTDKEKDNKKCY